MTVKKAIVVAVVVLLVVIGLPVLMPGMDMPSCSECGPAVVAGSCLPLFVGLVGLVIASASQRLRRRRLVPLELLRAMVFDRPPQLV